MASSVSARNDKIPTNTDVSAFNSLLVVIGFTAAVG